MANRATAMPTHRPVSLDEIPAITRGGKADKVVSDFLESGDDAWAIDAESKTFATTLQRYISKNDLGDQVEVVTRKNADGERDVFLRVKQEEAEAELVGAGAE